MKKIVGDNLKSWRKKFGYTQDTLADYLGIKRENISFYETGEREIPVIHLEKLSDLFGIEPEIIRLGNRISDKLQENLENYISVICKELDG